MIFLGHLTYFQVPLRHAGNQPADHGIKGFDNGEGKALEAIEEEGEVGDTFAESDWYVRVRPIENPLGCLCHISM